MEKIEEFLFPFVALLVIAALCIAFVRVYIHRKGDQYKSIDWHMQNHLRVSFYVGSPIIYFVAPALEEIVFRLPLLLLYDSVADGWSGILLSSVVFAAIHWFGKKVKLNDLAELRAEGLISDDFKYEIKQFALKNPKTILTRKITHVIMVFPLGVLAGYLSVQYQSLWLAFGIHAAWNIFMPIILMLIILGTSSVIWWFEDRTLDRKLKKVASNHQQLEKQ